MGEFIFRGGLPVAVPADYAVEPAHAALVGRLNRTTLYADAVRLLELHPNGFLAADVLRGTPWARRYLNSTARLFEVDRPLAQRGLRALMSVLNGRKARVGRTREPGLSPEQLGMAAAAITRWRAVVSAVWTQDQATRLQGVTEAAARVFPLSRAHRHALRLLMRRTRLRRHDVVLTLTSWETGWPIRRLRAAQPVADLVYG